MDQDDKKFVTKYKYVVPANARSHPHVRNRQSDEHEGIFEVQMRGSVHVHIIKKRNEGGEI